MALKSLVARKIMTEVIKGTAMTPQVGNQRKSFSRSYRVLVVDQLAMRIISSCCQLHDIAIERVTLVENIFKTREPIPSLEAIYFITPTKDSVKALMTDFENSKLPMYRAAHVFFTEVCAEELFNDLCKSKCAKYIKTLKEINVAFLPFEEKVFSLDSSEAFQYFYNTQLSSKRSSCMERMAEQVATMCATLGEYPSVRYRGAFEYNIELAQLVQEKLDAYKAEEPTMGEGPEKARSILLILDRGFDCVSPLLHELTYQAMAYDLLKIDNDVYEPHSATSFDREVILDDKDDLWVELRHQHIAVVSKNVTKKLKEFLDTNRMATDNASLKDLGQLIKKTPQYQQELNKYAKHLHLADDCLKIYQGHVDMLCRVEQDLAMGTDVEGEKIKDHMRNIIPILLDYKSIGITSYEKLRIILLYILSKNGVSEENLNKLIQHADIESELQCIITNLEQFGCNVLLDVNKKKPHRKERSTEHMYDMSRWTPVIKDIMEDAIEDKLDQKQFPFWAGRTSPSGFRVNTTPNSARFWKFGKGEYNVRSVPRVLVFIVGGVSFSEMRSAYEVTKASNKTWEVIIGSTHVLTPHGFLTDLKNLSRFL